MRLDDISGHEVGVYFWNINIKYNDIGYYLSTLRLHRVTLDSVEDGWDHMANKAIEEEHNA
jgi:hypothetical protein